MVVEWLGLRLGQEVGHQVGKGREPFRPHPVVALPADVVGDHETGIREHPQVLAHRGPADRPTGRELDDPGTAGGQGTQEVTSNRVGDSGEGIHPNR